MSDFAARLTDYVQAIEEALPAFLPPVCGDDVLAGEDKVAQAMSYSLLGGGKRLRGVLVLASCALFDSAKAQKAMPFAAALEMIHASSLIHDDLPCMDDDDLRRGKPACHIAFGEAMALLAGDALLVLPFAICAGQELRACFGAERVLDAMALLAEAIGVAGMIGGQAIDLQSEGMTADPELLRRMDNKKTGALIGAAVAIGCILGGADKPARDSMVQYATRLGLAFQIQDDILDATGDAAVLGKPIGSDAENQKATYVTLLGLDGAARLAADCTEQAAAALAEVEKQTGCDTAFLRDLLAYLLHRDH